MADAMTQQSSVDYDTTAFEAIAYHALRPELYYVGFVDVKPTNLTHRGAAVQWFFQSDLPVSTTPLTETVDPDAVAMADTTFALTLAEYGAAVNTTAKLRATSLIPINAEAANVIGYNAGITDDTLARNAMYAGTQALFGGTAADRTHIATGSTLSAANIRRARSLLRDQNVQPFANGLFRSTIHPDVTYDLMAETNGNNWTNPHQYNDPSAIYQGEIGAYGGVAFVETPRAAIFADASNGTGSTGTIDVYGTAIWGRQALAKAHSNGEGYSDMPQAFMGPVVDKLMRFQPYAWKHLVAYGIFRQAAIVRYESSSSIGANT